MAKQDWIPQEGFTAGRAKGIGFVVLALVAVFAVLAALFRGCD